MKILPWPELQEKFYSYINITSLIQYDRFQFLAWLVFFSETTKAYQEVLTVSCMPEFCPKEVTLDHLTNSLRML